MHGTALTKLSELEIGKINGRNTGRRQIDIVAQIGHEPIESWCIGQDPDRIVVYFEGLIDGFDDHGFAVPVMHNEVNRRRFMDCVKDNRDQHDFVEVGFHFIDIGVILENLISVFVRRHCARSIFLRCIGIGGIGGEIEESDVKALVIDAVDDVRQTHRVGA
jgi:hypothetical protein